MSETSIKVVEATELPGKENTIWNKMLRLAFKRNIQVDLVDLSNADTKGFWISCFQGEAIVIDITLDNKERDFVMAHELGHSVLHRGKGSFFNNSDEENEQIENEADRFAERLLKWLERGGKTDERGA